METDLEKGQGFNNYYEETKHLAEVEVRRIVKARDLRKSRTCRVTRKDRVEVRKALAAGMVREVARMVLAEASVLEEVAEVAGVEATTRTVMGCYPIVVAAAAEKSILLDSWRPRRIRDFVERSEEGEVELGVCPPMEAVTTRKVGRGVFESLPMQP